MQPANHSPVDWKAVSAVVLTTLILSIDHYRDLIPDLTWNSVLLYFLLPILVIVVFFRQSPASYGFCIGNWKLGLVASVISVVAVTLLLPLVLNFKEMN